MTMNVIHHAHLAADDAQADGAQRLCVAGRHCGVEAFEVWMQTLPPLAQSPPRRHDGELVAIALAGSGKLLLAGGPQRFQSPCTMVIAPAVEFQFVNNGAAPLQLAVVCTRTPVDENR
jgi:hypothetical protein